MGDDNGTIDTRSGTEMSPKMKKYTITDLYKDHNSINGFLTKFLDFKFETETTESVAEKFNFKL